MDCSVFLSELTVIYSTARDPDSQSSLWLNLIEARLTSDKSIDELSHSWPIDQLADYGQTYRSPRLFAAVLANHRSAVKPSGNFWDEVQFYTDVIDALLGWLNSEITRYRRGDLLRWLVAYSYLMGSLNYLGAEQALCHSFHSIVCFSHRETFFYANFSFAGEAVFRLYRQTFPRSREDGWMSLPHQRFFPRLSHCRSEIFSEADYFGMAIDPSMCDFSRRNETRFHETDLITVTELRLLVEEMDAEISRDRERARLWVIVSAGVLTATVAYAGLVHSLRCAWVRRRAAMDLKEWKAKEMDLVEDQIMDHLMATHRTNTVYERFNGEPNVIHATVTDYNL